MAVADENTVQLTRDFAAFSALIYVQFGAVVWDFVTTFPFDWAIIRGQNPLAWPMVAYFFTRYGSFVAMVPLLMQINANAGIDCSRLWVAIVMGIKMQKLGAEVLFGIRAMAVSEYNKFVVASVSFLWLLTAGFGLATIAGAKWSHGPAILPGLPQACQPVDWEWELGVAYILTLVYAIFVISIVVVRLRQMGQRIRSSLSALVYRDGILFLILSVVPTVAAVALFYAGKTPPAQSAAMTIAATAHSLLAARAYRNLSDFCEGLPICVRLKVSNGTTLDSDTLGRIAFMLGAPHEAHVEQGDVSITPTTSITGTSAAAHGGRHSEKQSAFTYPTSLNDTWNSEYSLRKVDGPNRRSMSTQSDTASQIRIVTQQEVLRDPIDERRGVPF